MRWHVADVKHRIEIYIELDTPKRVQYTTGSTVEVVAVQFNYEDGLPCYSSAGIQVYGRKVMFTGNLVQGKPVAYYLHFSEHPWLDNIRREIEDSYRIERPDYDVPPAPDTHAPAA